MRSLRSLLNVSPASYGTASRLRAPRRAPSPKQKPRVPKRSATGLLSAFRQAQSVYLREHRVLVPLPQRPVTLEDVVSGDAHCGGCGIRLQSKSSSKGGYVDVAGHAAAAKRFEALSTEIKQLCSERASILLSTPGAPASYSSADPETLFEASPSHEASLPPHLQYRSIEALASALPGVAPGPVLCVRCAVLSTASSAADRSLAATYDANGSDGGEQKERVAIDDEKDFEEGKDDDVQEVTEGLSTRTALARRQSAAQTVRQAVGAMLDDTTGDEAAQLAAELLPQVVADGGDDLDVVAALQTGVSGGDDGESSRPSAVAGALKTIPSAQGAMSLRSLASLLYARRPCLLVWVVDLSDRASSLFPQLRTLASTTAVAESVALEAAAKGSVEGDASSASAQRRRRRASGCEVLVVGNKLDLMPMGLSRRRVEAWLATCVAGCGLRVVGSAAVSAMWGSSVDIAELSAYINELRRGGDVIFAGGPNCGKSALLNRILGCAAQSNSGFYERREGDDEAPSPSQKGSEKSGLLQPATVGLSALASKDAAFASSLVTSSSAVGTTLRALGLPLREGGMVVDTPGVAAEALVVVSMPVWLRRRVTPKAPMDRYVFILQPRDTLHILGLYTVTLKDGPLHGIRVVVVAARGLEGSILKWGKRRPKASTAAIARAHENGHLAGSYTPPVVLAGGKARKSPAPSPLANEKGSCVPSVHPLPDVLRPTQTFDVVLDLHTPRETSADLSLPGIGWVSVAAAEPVAFTITHPPAAVPTPSKPMVRFLFPPLWQLGKRVGRARASPHLSRLALIPLGRDHMWEHPLFHHSQALKNIRVLLSDTSRVARPSKRRTSLVMRARNVTVPTAKNVPTYRERRMQRRVGQRSGRNVRIARRR